MAIFKLTKQELIKQWWNDFYEVEADTLEEAIQKILDYEEDPYDSEPVGGNIGSTRKNYNFR